MGCSVFRLHLCLTVILNVYFGFLSGVITEVLPECQTNETKEQCCASDQPEVCGISNGTCQKGCLMIKCESLTIPTTAPITTMTTSAGNNTNTTDSMNPDDEDSGINVAGRIVCINDCPDNYEYNSTSFKCMRCNETEGGSNGCVQRPEPKEDAKQLPVVVIAAAAGSGGFLLLLIIVVFIICCCRRKRDQSKERRPISVLAENRTLQREPPERPETKDSRSDLTRPRNYENTGGTLRPSTDTIQQQGDQIFRYTKDPTMKEKKPEEDSRASLYGNEAMIRLAKKIDTTKIDSKELQEHLEVEELGTAPTPLPEDQSDEVGDDYLPMTRADAPPIVRPAGAKSPMQLPGTQRHAVRKLASTLLSDTASPLNIAEQKMSRKPPTVKTKPVRPQVHKSSQPSGSASDLGGLEGYEDIQARNMQNEVEKRRSPEDAMEDYENVAKYSSSQQLLSNTSKTDLEDYENAETFHKEESSSGGKIGLAKSESKKSLEDYENAETYKKAKGVASVQGIDLEDYENLTDNLPVYENTNFPNKKQ